MFIQTEKTPNDNAIKFLTGSTILDESGPRTIEFVSRKDALKSPLALKLFGVPGVVSVMFGSDFITVTKDDSSQWTVLKPDLFSIIIEHLSSSLPILGDLYFRGVEDASASADAGPGLDSDHQQIVSEIKELLDTRIRPSIMEDGGDLEFVSFDKSTGILSVTLQGACRGCSSSEVTLKNGIENMLTYYIPEVKSVLNVGSELEKLSNDEFSKFSSKLEHQ
ncbi:NifU-like protein [Smittium mucronatum]|uniref:NifU-like protein n=1 Tax=Smittium mucronatum TaxID=133383 RepID=A0A1R0GNU2_9FUNG|nr:NifU-like protein [Smittium mucronatum]